METKEHVKHTAGPWISSLPDADGYSHINSSTWGELAKAVVMVQDEYTGKFSASAEGEANARLIAAAPELLEALEDMLDLTVNRKGGQWTEGEIAVACKFARSAIAKAEGR